MGCKGYNGPRGLTHSARTAQRVHSALNAHCVCAAGTVVSEPPAISKPYNDSQYDGTRALSHTVPARFPLCICALSSHCACVHCVCCCCRYDGTSIVSTIKRLFNLPNFLTKRDAWSASFAHLFDELPSPRTDTPYHLPDAPPPTHRHGPHPYGTDCDDPTRRMRRSIRSFEESLGVTAPERLHQCSEPGEGLFTSGCGVGSMVEASEWLANATSAWRQQQLQRRQ